MEAKDAILKELGDFGVEDDSQKKDMSVSETKEVISEDTESTTSTAEEKEPDIFEQMETLWVEGKTSEPMSDESDESEAISSLSDAELNANKSAVVESILSDSRMSDAAFKWGMSYLDKIHDEQMARMDAQIKEIDWDAAQAEWDQEEAEEAQQEKEEEKQFLEK